MKRRSLVSSRWTLLCCADFSDSEMVASLRSDNSGACNSFSNLFRCFRQEIDVPSDRTRSDNFIVELAERSVIFISCSYFVSFADLTHREINVLSSELENGELLPHPNFIAVFLTLHFPPNVPSTVPPHFPNDATDTSLGPLRLQHSPLAAHSHSPYSPHRNPPHRCKFPLPLWRPSNSHSLRRVLPLGLHLRYSRPSRRNDACKS